MDYTSALELKSLTVVDLNSHGCALRAAGMTGGLDRATFVRNIMMERPSLDTPGLNSIRLFAKCQR